MEELTFLHFKEEVLSYIESMRVDDASYGRYRYASCQKEPILYASVYAALGRDLLGDLSALSDGQRKEWISHIQSFQDEDGLFKDPLIAHPGSWYVPPHMEWCGWWHLSTHVIIALAALGAVVAKEFSVIKPYFDEKFLRDWLATRDLSKMDFVGNEVLNIGMLLQYARDFQNDRRAAVPMEMILDWLDQTQDPNTGMWGPSATSEERNKAYQGAYHFYLLYDYDNRPIKFPERIVDSMLSMQTPQGGFGVHEDSSGCEDIDAIDPLARMYSRTQHRHDEIKSSLEQAMAWVLQNRTCDGGFSFIRNKRFFYGSNQMTSEAGEGCAFAAWWRMLSIAIIATVVKNHELSRIPWRFLKCPGYQYLF